jgi:hypothetical protein
MGYNKEALRALNALCFPVGFRPLDSLSSAMRLTTFLTTIRVRPLESDKVQNPCVQGKPDMRGRSRTRCRCFASKGLGVRVPLAPPYFTLSEALLPPEESLRRSEYRSKVQQRFPRVVMLGGRPAAHRTPSMYASPFAGHLELTRVLAFMFV